MVWVIDMVARGGKTRPQDELEGPDYVHYTDVEREINADSPLPSSRSRRRLPRLGRQNITGTALGQYSPVFAIQAFWWPVAQKAPADASGGARGPLGCERLQITRRFVVVERMMVFAAQLIAFHPGADS
jgi:hypothetical protein